MKIVNLTQHAASDEQVAAGVFNLEGEDKEILLSSLNFNSLPTTEVVQAKAGNLALLAKQSGAQAAMIGGAPYLMAHLERALLQKGVMPCYAFSPRESVEKVVDGKTVKTSVFHHQGFYWPYGKPVRVCTCGSDKDWQQCGNTPYCG